MLHYWRAVVGALIFSKRTFSFELYYLKKMIHVLHGLFNEIEGHWPAAAALNSNNGYAVAGNILIVGTQRRKS